MQERVTNSNQDEALLLEERRGAVAILTLNRPEARNSLSLALLRALGDAVGRLSVDADVRAVVIAANGPVFSAGHDLKELTAHRSDPDGGLAFYRTAMVTCSEMMQAILRSPKPFIAAVQGVATAAGCQLVATCDLAVAAEGAHFATPGVNIGLFCSTPMVALSRNVPRKRAMEMLLLGEMLPAATAAEYGLVNRVVPQDRVLGRGARDGQRHRIEIIAHRGYRQGGVLPPGRDADRGSLCLRGRCHGPKHDGARRR